MEIRRDAPPTYFSVERFVEQIIEVTVQSFGISHYVKQQQQACRISFAFMKHAWYSNQTIFPDNIINDWEQRDPVWILRNQKNNQRYFWITFRILQILGQTAWIWIIPELIYDELLWKKHGGNCSFQRIQRTSTPMRQCLKRSSAFTSKFSHKNGKRKLMLSEWGDGERVRKREILKGKWKIKT